MKNKRRLLGLTATASLLSLSAVLTSCDKVKEYTVTFKNGSETITTQPVKDGYNATVPTAPTSGDLEFNGWYKDEAKTTPFDFGSVITEDTTVYANWVNKYTVTFNSNGGSNVAAATVREGSNVKVPTAPTKAGRVFNGWFSDADCTKEFNFGSVITKNTTLYAKWELASYNVNLYLPSGELYKTVGVKDGELLNVGENPEIHYQTFAGWYTDASCSEDSVFDVTLDTISEDTNLYAKFEAKVEEVTYTFDYQSFIDKYGAGNKSTQIEKMGGFYINAGAYAENTKKNYVTNVSNDPDVNNQNQPIWFTSVSAGTFSFDWRYRSGSSSEVTIYEIDAITDNTKAPALADMVADNAIYDKTSGNGEHAEVDIKAGKSYVIFSTASVQIQQLKYTNTVGASKPESISVAGALSGFLCGDTFNSTGLTINMTYENGRSESVAARDVTVDTSAVDMTKEGTYTVTVKYNAEDDYGTYPLTDTYEINVYAVDTIKAFTYSIDGSRNTVYNKLVYAVGDTLNTSKIYVHAYGKIGEGENATDIDDQLETTEWELDGTVDMSTAGRKTVTLKYKKDPNVKTTFEIEVVEKVFNENSTSALVTVDASVEAATKDGSNSYKFKSITEALQYFELCKVPASAEKRILLNAGTYNEKVFIDMPNVKIMGSAISKLSSLPTTAGTVANSPVITFNAMNGIKAPNGVAYSTDGAATFTISKKATGCMVAGVKIMNYYNTNALYNESLKITKDTQATACLVRGDQAIFEFVTFSGYHDTLYADLGRQYYHMCDIEGRTDFIFGADATAYFQDCTIRTLGAGLTEKNGGYVVATKGTDGMNYGYIFNQCNFVADENVQNGCVSIARGWDKFMKIMVMNCNLGAHFSNGTYGQTYYEKTVTATSFAELAEIGLYTKDEAGKYNKVASTAEFDAEATYYIQLNDRYTKMNADPVPALLSEYNNEGNGAITYTADEAAKYAEKTFTLLNPQDQATVTAMAKYEDLNTVFKADNGSVKYAENWNPAAVLDSTVIAKVVVNVDGSTVTASPVIKLTNVYKDNTLVDSQITTIKNAVKEVLKDGYSLVGLYTDAEFTTELTAETILTSNTNIYARVVEGTLTIVNLAQYTGTNVLATAEGVNKDEVWTASLEKDGSEKVSSTVNTDIKKASDTTDDTYQTFERSANGTVLTSPKITESVKELSLVIYGGTASTSNSMQVEIKAFDSSNNKIGEVLGYTPGSKKSGYVTTSASADHSKEEKIVLKSSGADISYVTVTLINKKADGNTADSKSFTFASINASYEKIVKNTYKDVNATYAYDYSKIDLSASTTKTAIAKKNLTKYTSENWATKVTKIFYKNGDTYEEVTTYEDYQTKCAEFASLGDSDNTSLFDCDKSPLTTAALNANNLAVNGNVTFRSLYQSSLGVVEVAKEAGIKVTFKGTGTLTLIMSSSSSSKTSTFGVKDAAGNFLAANDGFGKSIKVAAVTNNYDISGTAGGADATITYNITKAGTYEVFIPSTSANVARIAKLEAKDNYKEIDNSNANEFQPITVDSTNWTCVAGADNQTIFSNDLVELSTTKFAAIETCGAGCSDGESTGGKMNSGKTISFKNKSDKTLYFTIKVVGNGDNKTLVNTADATDVITMTAKAYVLKTITVAAGTTVTYNSTGGVYFVSCVVTDTQPE